MREKHLLPPPDKSPGEEDCDFSTDNFYENMRRDMNSDRMDRDIVDPQMVTMVEEDEALSEQPSFEKPEENLEQKLQRKALLCMYFEKIVEIGLVFTFILVAVYWEPLKTFVLKNAWPITAFIVISMMSLAVMCRLAWFKRFPGFLLYKLLYLYFVTAIFFGLAIHVPRLLTFLSPYFALVAAGSIAATYILFSFITVTHTRLCGTPAKGCYLWLLIFSIPICVLIINQPIYFSAKVWHFRDYSEFMLNVTAGIVISFPFSREALSIYQVFVNSKDVEMFITSPDILPGFTIAWYVRKFDEDASNAEHPV